MLKTCNKCLVERSLDSFAKDNSTKDFLQCTCRFCAKALYRENKDKIDAQHRQYYYNNKDTVSTKQRDYYHANSNKVLVRQKQYNAQNAEVIKVYNKKYKKENRIKFNLKNTTKRKQNIQFRISCNLRTRLHHAMRSKNKIGSAVGDLGCTSEFLTKHLAAQFSSYMTWDNYGIFWQIDHIIPLCHFDLTKRDQFLEACNYKNLRPLEIQEHKTKSRSERRRV